MKFTFTKTFLISYLLSVSSLLIGQPFYHEDFSNIMPSTNLPVDWSSEDVSENLDGDGEPLDLLWKACTNAQECPPFKRWNEKFASETANNGYVFADAEVFENNPNIHDPYIAQLTSRAIFIDENEEEIFLSFQSLLRTFRIHEHEGTRLRISTNGTDWEHLTIYPEVPSPTNQFQRTYNANYFLIDISSYVSGENEIYLQWQWTGESEYHWCLDDIKLYYYNPENVRVIWGEHEGESDFSGGLNNWTVEHVSNDTCAWKWQSYGSTGNALTELDNHFINSPTAQNGAMVINPDFCITNNEIPPMGQPPLVISELISPNIDLSNSPEHLLLRFYQSFRLFNAAAPGYSSVCSYAYSIDDATTWSANIPLNQAAPINKNIHNKVEISLPAEIEGESTVRIKFTFAGFVYFWAIDDVKILERPAIDLKIRDDFYAIPANFQTPKTQVDVIGFLADVENFGLTPQQDVYLSIDIKETDSGAIVHADTILIGDIDAIEVVENQLFNNIFLPPATVQDYTGTYTIFSELEDEMPENNSISFAFEITENTFAKEAGTTAAFTPEAADANDFSYSWGNCFYVPNGDMQYAKEVIFSIGGDLEAVVGNIVTVELYEWTDNTISIFTATPSEYKQLAVNAYQITGLEEEFITLPIQMNNETILLSSGTQHFVVVRYTNTLAAERLFLSASQEFDYSAMYLTSDSLNNYRYATMLDVGNTGIFDVIGLENGWNTVPVVRLVTSDSPTPVGEIKSLNISDLKLSPNPVISQLTFETPLFAQQEKSQLNITDAKGKVVLRKIIHPSDERRISLNVGSLANGFYQITLSNRQGTVSSNFIKQ